MSEGVRKTMKKENKYLALSLFYLFLSSITGSFMGVIFEAITLYYSIMVLWELKQSKEADVKRDVVG